METQSFSAGELQAELERSLGFTLRSLERLGGAAALNYKAVRDSDGLAFAVKCSPPKSQQLFERLVEHLDSLKGTKALARIFESECVKEFRGFNILCTAWCEGERKMPHELTDEQFVKFLSAYQDFSAAMLRVKTFDGVRPYPTWRSELETKCNGLARSLLRTVWSEMPLADCTHDPKLLRIIHSDFHHGNFLFANGALERVLDIEALRQGYPVEDIVRYIVCAADHQRFGAANVRRAILEKFALAVRELPYSRHEWMLAINGNFLRIIFMRTRKLGRIGCWRALDIRRRAKLYRAMRAIVNLGFRDFSVIRNAPQSDK